MMLLFSHFYHLQWIFYIEANDCLNSIVFFVKIFKVKKCLRYIVGDFIRKKQNDARLVNEITRRNSDHHVCFLGFHHPRDQVKCSIVSCIPWIKLYFSSIAWVIKMERIHYERQHKLEQIATEMYKNSVLVSEFGSWKNSFIAAFKSIRIKLVRSLP